MTKEEIEEVRDLYKKYKKDNEKTKAEDDNEILRKIYIDKAKESKELFNIKVYMGSYYYYNGIDSDEFSYLNDILTLENDPRAVYRVFCDIESTWNNREEIGEFIYYHEKEKLEEYEQKNTIIVVPNEEIRRSIIEASKYSDFERFHGVNRFFGLYGSMDKSIKFNIKGDIDSFGDLVPLQNYFFNQLMNMQPEEAVAQLTKKYRPYRNFYDYNNMKK